MVTSPGVLDFQAPDNVVFGRGCVDSLGDRLRPFGDSILLVTDEGIRDAGLVATAIDSVDSDAEIHVYDGVEPDPSVRHVREALSLARERGVDAVIGLGGGSSMDVAKATAGVYTHEESLDELLGRHTLARDPLPTVLVPTTAGTGSEVSSGAVLFDDDGHKRGLADDRLYAHTALVDPRLSMHLPAPITKSSGLDAYAHAVGSLVSTTTNPLADALCTEAIAMIEEHLRPAAFHGADAPESREHMALAATMAMLGRVNGGKAAIHSFAYGIQDAYGLPHGEAIAMILPEVVELNLPAALDSLGRLGTQVYGASGSRRTRAATAVEGMYGLRNDLDMERSLQSVGATKDDLTELSRLCLRSERHLEANPRTLTPDDARAVLERVWERSEI